MVNVALLEEKIVLSGKKKEYLAEKCGLSRQGFWNKCQNKNYFTAHEIKILCKELGITKLTEKERIFLRIRFPN